MIKTFFQDDSIIVIEKEAGLVTISDTGNKKTLADLVKDEFGIDSEVSIVHRLDKDTSGVMVLAKNPKSRENLQNQFKDRKVKKEYLALVHGLIDKSGTVDANIIRNPGDHTKFISVDSEEGRLAATEYEPIKQWTIDNGQLTKIFAGFNKNEIKKLLTINYSLFTLLKCHPLTGRTHQIRVHLKYINHPIVSDQGYAGRKTLKLDLVWCPRMFLHAAKLGFYHPARGEWMEFECGLPEDLKSVLNTLSSPT